MAATIQSLRNGITPIVGGSRDDLVLGDVVTLTATDPHTTYSWIIAFAPETSSATLANPTLQTPGTFVVDVEGPYLIQLTVDAGLPTEDTQEVRLRALTEFGQLTLVAAGERRDDTGIIPVDVDTEGWANEQNFNLVTLKDFIKPMVQSGRVLFVDSNDGTQGYGDFSSIQGAIDAAFGNTPTLTEQWLVLVRPGAYAENLIFRDWIHVIGWPGKKGNDQTQDVEVTGTHTAAISSGVITKVSNLTLQTTAVTTSATLTLTGAGQLLLTDSQVLQLGVDAAQGPAIDLQGGSLVTYDTLVQHITGGGADRVAVLQSGTATTLSMRGGQVIGPVGVSTNPNLLTNTMSTRMGYVSVVADNIAVLADGSSFAATHCVFDGGLDPVFRVHPTGGVLASSIDLTLEFSSILGNLYFDTTNVGGTTALRTGGVRYGSLVTPGGAPTTIQALTQSYTHFYDNTVSGLLAENVQDAIDELAGGATAAFSPLVYHRNMPALANDSVRYRGWAPVTADLIAVRVMMESVNTQGNYTLTVTNETTGNPMLSAASFDMNTLVAGTPTPVAISAVPADISFATLDEWTIELTSDDPGFDGSGVYVSLVFNTATGGAAVIADWATTLLLGNISGGTNPVISTGDIIQFGDSPAAPVSGAGTGRIRYNDATATFQTSTNGGAWTDIGTGSGGGTPFVHKNIPVVANDSVTYNGWIPVAAVATDISVMMTNVNTQGNYTAVFTNEATGNTMLAAASFDMNTLAANTVTSLTLTGTPADLTFAAGDAWSVTMTSDDPAFDGSGVYFSILWGTAGALTITAAPDDDHQFEMAVSPGNTVSTNIFAPYNMTLVAAKAYVETQPTTAGTYTLAIQDADSANNLLSTATVDMTSFLSGTFNTLTLTGTTANLDMSLGTRIQVTLDSDNADLTGSGVYIQLIYRSQ